MQSGRPLPIEYLVSFSTHIPTCDIHDSMVDLLEMSKTKATPES